MLARAGVSSESSTEERVVTPTFTWLLAVPGEAGDRGCGGRERERDRSETDSKMEVTISCNIVMKMTLLLYSVSWKQPTGLAHTQKEGIMQRCDYQAGETIGDHLRAHRHKYSQST